jgi:hypothetical protein
MPHATPDWTGVQATLWQLSREKSLSAKRCEMKGNSGHTSKANSGSDICEFESSMPSQPVRSLLFDFRVFSNSGRGVKLSMNILAGCRVLSAAGACPPHESS